MKRLAAWMLVAVAVVFQSFACAYDSCRISEPRQVTVSAEGATLLRIDAKAGSLRVYGQKSLTEVRATGTACAGNRKALDEVELRVARSGSEIHVLVQIPDDWARGGALDLEVLVPFGLPLVIEDTAGEIDIREVASLDLTDGGGPIDVVDVLGDVTIRDTSGEIDMSDIGGDVTIHDGSGEIDLRDVAGSVFVEDGSGEIDIGTVAGSVTVGSDGTGGIAIEDVDKDVLIGRDGPGEIRVSNIGGAFVVRTAGSGPVGYSGVAGRVDVPGR